MTQDTRKDRRAKIVSLNVRYKSATVDEFIENHSHDVSRGGIFIKTPTPFPPGTLLKFEIRIAGDRAVIAGVGRVVWKREASQATVELPAGMGVKFIKLDDASRVVIDKLVEMKGDEAGAAFEAGNVEAAPGSQPLPALPIVGGAPPASSPRPSPFAPSTVERTGTSSPLAPTPVERTKPASPFAPSSSKMAVAKRQAVEEAPRKPTMMGLGSSGDKAVAGAVPTAPGSVPRGLGSMPGAAASVPRPGASPSAAMKGGAAALGTAGGAASGPMFPQSEPEPPPAEPTVMRQAAELLEEALRGAGGSMDEIGNPLFEASKSAGPGKSTFGQKRADEDDPTATALGRSEVAAALRESTPPGKDERPGALLDATGAVSKRDPGVGPADTAAGGPPPSSRAARATPAVASVPPPRQSGGGRVFGYLLVLGALGVVGYFAWAQVYQPGAQPVATPTQAAPPPVSAPPPPSASAVASASAGPAESASAAATASASASASASAVASAAKPPPAVVAPKPPAPKPPQPTAPTAASSASEGTTATEASASASAAPAPKPPAPKPVWHPPPKKPSEDDNPY